MVPNTETAFYPEGSRDRLQNLLSDYKSSQTKRDTEKIPEREKTSLVFEIGEELLKLKKSLGFGSFIKTVKSMGISRNAAQDYMRVAQRFGAYRDVVKDIGASKLCVLAHRKNENIKILIDGGALSGITLADIDRMSIREVRNCFQNKRLTKPITWRNRLLKFTKYIKLAFSALAGGAA